MEDGLTDLRESLMIFVEKLVRKIGRNQRIKLQKNLKTLEEKGYIDTLFIIHICDMQQSMGLQ